MRGTLHFVAKGDVRWMLALLAPRLVRANAGRHRQLGLDEAAFARARKILARSMSGAAPLSRRATYDALERGGVSPAGQRGIHILWYLAQEGLICCGPREGKQPTFVLFDEWVPRGAEPSREEALARLAIAYFRSHGPADLNDFAWWSGLLMKDALAAIAEAGDAIVRETGGERATWTAAGTGPFRARDDGHRAPSCCRRGTSTWWPTRIARPRSAISPSRRR